MNHIDAYKLIAKELDALARKHNDKALSEAVMYLVHTVIQEELEFWKLNEGEVDNV